jgi:hypothetical protein
MIEFTITKQQIVRAEMLYKFNGNPDGNELPCNRNQLEEKPFLTQGHLFYHAPGIVKWNQCLPGCNACFFKHAIHTCMPSYNTY